MRRTRTFRAVAFAALLAAGCGVPSPSPGASPGRSEAAGLVPTPAPAFGLTWGLVQDVERDEEAFEIPSNLPTGPTGPDTPGHPGNFPGQSIIRDVTGTDRLVAVGYTAIAGDWTADAWTSTDASHWALAPIDERTGSFAEAVATVGAGGGSRFVAVGRVGSDAVAWTSADGRTWTPAAVPRLTEGARAGEPERMTAILATQDGLLAGGSAGPELGDRRARFWRSADGATWTPLPDDEGFDGGEVSAIVATATGFVALGRLGTGQRSTGSVVWLSPDGTSWRRVDDPALSTGLAVACVATESGLLAVGSDADEREAVAWSSPDGETWTRAPREDSRLHFGEKVRMTGLVATEAGFVGVGNYVGVQYGTGTSWLSTDGLRWTRGPDQAALGQGEPEAVIAWRDRLVAVGSRGAPDNYIPSVWISPNAP